MGITESEFWDMTIAEYQRLLASRRRTMKAQAQEKASFDYILADMIGRSVARVYSSSAHLPEISEAYPSLFDSKEILEKKKEQKVTLSALRFRLFAEAHNSKFKKEAAN